MYLYTYVCACMYIHTCASLRGRPHVVRSIYVYTHTHTYIHVSIHIRMCMHVYTHMCIVAWQTSCGQIPRISRSGPSVLVAQAGCLDHGTERFVCMRCMCMHACVVRLRCTRLVSVLTCQSVLSICLHVTTPSVLTRVLCTDMSLLTMHLTSTYPRGSVTAEFCEINGLELVCRAHQLVQEGFKYMFPQQVNLLCAVCMCAHNSLSLPPPQKKTIPPIACSCSVQRSGKWFLSGFR